MLSKFLNTKTLIILLVILLGIYLVTTLTKSEDRTFKSELVAIDTSKVTEIKIMPKVGSDGQVIVLTRAGQEWKLSADGKPYKADMGAIKNVLNVLKGMRTERVAATNKSKWKEMEVTDSTATRIQLYNNGDLLADLYLGKFSYKQAPQSNQFQQQRQQARMFTNIRPADEETVYVVEGGFIKMNIQPNVNSYRAKTLASIKKEDITKISYDYPDGDFTLQKDGNNWSLNGIPTDSTQTARYLQKFARLTSTNFVDDIETQSSTPSFSVKIEGNNFAPIELRAFDADTTNKYLITSSQIPDAKFSGSKSRIFERVFIDMQDLMPKQD